MVIAQVQHSVWVFHIPAQTGPIHEEPMNANPNRVMICLAEAIPPTATGLLVWLRGGPVDVAVLWATGVGFASIVAVESIQAALVKLAEVYQSKHIDIEPIEHPEA